MYPNEIIQLVKLPEHLANHPYLIEYYGTVEWSVKAVFTNYMGWYSGKASELHPLSYKEEAALLVDLAGGPDTMFEKLKQAYEADKFQWAIQLSDNLLEVGKFEREAKVCKYSFCGKHFRTGCESVKRDSRGLHIPWLSLCRLNGIILVLSFPFIALLYIKEVG